MSQTALFLHHYSRQRGNKAFRALYARTLLPLIKQMEAQPNIRLGLYLDGFCLDWIEANTAECQERIAQLVATHQLEFLGGPRFHAALPLLPDRDQRGQLEDMAEQLERLFGAEPQGAWLPLSIWSPELARPLVDSGYRYVVLHPDVFMRSGLDPMEIRGPYVVEHGGRLLHTLVGWPTSEPSNLQPTKKGFKLYTQLLTAYNPGELIRSISLDLPRSALEHRAEPIWLSTFSTPEAEQLATSIRPDSKPQSALYAPPFAMFLHKYPAARDLWAKMRYVSDKIEEAKRPPEAAYDHLYRAQTLDPYWPAGLFEPSTRIEAWRELIRAENVLEPRKYAWLEIEQPDLFHDGQSGLVAESHTLNLYFEPAHGAGLVALDVRGVDWPFLAALSGKLHSLIDVFLPPSVSAAEAWADLGPFTASGSDRYYETAKYRDRVTFSSSFQLEKTRLELRKAVRILHKSKSLDFEWRIVNTGKHAYQGIFATALHLAPPPGKLRMLGAAAKHSPTQAWTGESFDEVGLAMPHLPLEVRIISGGRSLGLAHRPLWGRSGPEQGADTVLQGFRWVLFAPLELPPSKSRRLSCRLQFLHA